MDLLGLASMLAQTGITVAYMNFGTTMQFVYSGFIRMHGLGVIRTSIAKRNVAVTICDVLLPNFRYNLQSFEHCVSFCILHNFAFLSSRIV
jgi:hypothetical protein